MYMPIPRIWINKMETKGTNQNTEMVRAVLITLMVCSLLSYLFSFAILSRLNRIEKQMDQIDVQLIEEAEEDD